MLERVSVLYGNPCHTLVPAAARRPLPRRQFN
jgi:hypothetical protein